MKDLLEALRKEFSVPAEEDKYNGKAPEWIVVNSSDDRPIVRADDVDIIGQITLQAHFFCLKNARTRKNALRRFLRNRGLTILATEQLYEDDTKLTHIIVECQTEYEVDD